MVCLPTESLRESRDRSWCIQVQGPIGREIENGPRPEMGKNGPKMGKKKNNPKSHFFAIFGPYFPHVGPCFFCFLRIFSIFGFRPVFHCMPGGLTRNTCPLGQIRRCWGSSGAGMKIRRTRRLVPFFSPSLGRIHPRSTWCWQTEIYPVQNLSLEMS